jgi:hypothetical protein
LQKVKTGKEPTVFAAWVKYRTLDEPDPETGSTWINPNAGIKSSKYTGKFKQRNGEDADPLTSGLDVDAVMLAGEGKKNGRLIIGDGSVNPAYIPSLRQLRRGLKPGDPGVERRVPFSVAAVDEIRVCS